MSIVVAIIADYDRRAREIRKGALSEDLLSTYIKYNSIVDDALTHVEVEARKAFLSDIATGRGYDHSLINWMYNRKAYYSRKREVIYYTSVGLGLAE